MASLNIEDGLYINFKEVVAYRRGIKRGNMTEELELAIREYIEKYKPK
jgi:hypothetical protein